MVIMKSVRDALYYIDYSSIHADGDSMLHLLMRASSHTKDYQHQYQPRFSLLPSQHHDDMVLSGCRNWNDGGSESGARPSYPVL